MEGRLRKKQRERGEGLKPLFFPLCVRVCVSESVPLPHPPPPPPWTAAKLQGRPLIPLVILP